MVQLNTVTTDQNFWDSFYQDVLGSAKAGQDLQKRASTMDGIGSGASWSGLQDFALAGKGAATNTLADGTVVESKGAAVDFLNRILGTSPLSGDTYHDQKTGEVVSPGTGSPDGFDIGPLIARGAVIIAGFIFVAAGLAMFKPGVTVVQSAKNLGDGVAKGAAIA